MNSIVYAQSSASLPFFKGINIQTGVKYKSQSGKHYLMIQQDGNLVLMISSNQKVWGLNEVFSNFRQVSSIKLQDDGNLVARNSSISMICTFSKYGSRLSADHEWFRCIKVGYSR